MTSSHPPDLGFSRGFPHRFRINILKAILLSPVLPERHAHFTLLDLNYMSDIKYYVELKSIFFLLSPYNISHILGVYLI